MRKMTLRVLTAALCGSLSSAACAQTVGENIALGKPVTFMAGRVPNYDLTTDADDAIQLTDGQRTSNETSFWVQKSSVGWVRLWPVITLDLGRVQPISGVAFHTAAGRAGVTWPQNIYIAVSDDGQKWNYVGDLVKLSQPQVPVVSEETVFQLATRALKTKGRYVTLGVVGEPYIFVDEIEVYRGEETWLNQPAGGQEVSDVATLIDEAALALFARKRMVADAETVRAELPRIDDAKLRNALSTQLDALQTEASALERLPKSSKTILPLNETHRKILALHARVLSAQKHAPLVVWKKPRYAAIPLLATPDKNARPSLEIQLLKNQRRSDALLFTNTESAPKTASLRVLNAPKNAPDGWLKISSVEWTDTKENIPVASALLPIAPQNGVYNVVVPAGMTRKIWVTADGAKLPAGDFTASLRAESGGVSTAIPLRVQVIDRTMNTPRLSLGTWDYTNNGGSWGITSKIVKTAIDIMRSHHVDTPWASPAVLPWPDADAFDGNGKLIKPLDFSAFDQWVSMWPNARHYFVFANVTTKFAGAEIETPEYSQRMGAWAKAFAQHVVSLGLKPSQIGVLLSDEPREESQDKMIVEQVRIFKDAAPELQLFTDPVWERPDQTKYQEAITGMDIISPQLPIYHRGGAPVKNYFENLRQSGKTLWIYQCDGPARPFSPQLYYRYSAWHAFQMGATGQGFWAFGDSSGAPTSWQSYLMSGPGFEPAFLDENTVHDSLHWEAVREGIEDYEELAMLREAISKTRNATLKAQAQRVLSDAVSAITGQWNEQERWQWSSEKRPELADEHLKKVRAMLVKLPA